MFTWKCRSCPASFGDRKVRKHHWDSLHKIESNQTCEFCGRTFDTQVQLNRHAQVHDKTNHVTCQLCGKLFTSKGNMKIHSRFCLQNFEFSCPVMNCTEKFIYKNAVQTHLVRVHGHEREFECKQCGTQFIHKKNYKRHLKKHENNPDKEFKTQPIRTSYTKKDEIFWKR